MEIKQCPKCSGTMFVVHLFMQNPDSPRIKETRSHEKFFRCKKCKFETNYDGENN